MAAVKLGKLASVKKGANTVALMTSFNLNVAQSFVDGTSFLDEFEQPVPVMGNWNATISGYFDPSDTEQASLESLALSGGKMTDIRLYIDGTSYYTPDVNRDVDAGAYIESFTPAADKSGIVNFSMNLKGVGPIHRV